MAKREVRKDFEGWPEYALTVGLLKELLEKADDDAEVWIHEDDGMGYCANPVEAVDGYISTVDGKQQVQIWC